MGISQVSDEKKNAIKNASVLDMPARPTEAGYTIEQVKKAFTNPVFGDANSVLSELMRVINEANNAFAEKVGGAMGKLARFGENGSLYNSGIAASAVALDISISATSGTVKLTLKGQNGATLNEVTFNKDDLGISDYVSSVLSNYIGKFDPKENAGRIVVVNDGGNGDGDSIEASDFSIDDLVYGISLSIDSDYKLTATLKDVQGNTLVTSNAIDLPLESMVIGASYSDGTVTLQLKSDDDGNIGNTVSFSISELISGLVNEANGTKTNGNVASWDGNGKLTDGGVGVSSLALKSEVTPKAAKVASATEDDLASLTSDGDLADSGIPKDKVARVDGSYDLFTAGLAKNFQGRANSAVSADFTFRTSGGSADIGNPQATIKSIHGNTIIDDGALLHFNGTGLKTVGFNQWDEEWEIGGMWADTGEKRNDVSNRIRSKNYISVLPNTYYYFAIPNASTTAVSIHAYNKDKEWIGLYQPSSGGNTWITSGGAYNLTYQQFKTPNNAAYLLFGLGSAYGTTYKNDICINLSHSGYRNGEYEPYWSSTLPLPVSTYFPTGMKSAGSVYDELTEKKAVQRVGTRPYAEGDDSDSTVTTDGATTCYALDTPVETDVDLNFAYKVDDYGTEQLLPENDDEPTTSPFDGLIHYAMNAVDKLNRLPDTPSTTGYYTVYYNSATGRCSFVAEGSRVYQHDISMKNSDDEWLYFTCVNKNQTVTYGSGVLTGVPNGSYAAHTVDYGAGVVIVSSGAVTFYYGTSSKAWDSDGSFNDTATKIY